MPQHRFKFFAKVYFSYPYREQLGTSSAITKIGNSIQYSFNVTFELSYPTGRYSEYGFEYKEQMRLDAPYPMKCTVDDRFSASSSSNLENEIKPSLNSTFELLEQDIRWVLKFK